MWSKRENRHTWSARAYDSQNPKCSKAFSSLFLCRSLPPSLRLRLRSGLAFWPFVGRSRISSFISEALLAKSFKIRDDRPKWEHLNSTTGPVKKCGATPLIDPSTKCGAWLVAPKGCYPQTFGMETLEFVRDVMGATSLRWKNSAQGETTSWRWAWSPSSHFQSWAMWQGPLGSTGQCWHPLAQLRNFSELPSSSPLL